MPISLTPDLLSAPASEQLQYFSSVDPDFAKADPRDQLAYLTHLHGVAPVAGPQRPQVNMQPSQDLISQIGGRTNFPPPKGMMAKQTQPNAAVGALALGGAGAMGGAAALPFLKAAIKPVTNWIGDNPVKASIGIEVAKRLPGTAGQIAAHIPSYAPFFLGGKKAPVGEPDATRENVPYAGEEVPTPKIGGPADATRENVPYAGEDPSVPEPGTQSKTPGFGFKQGRLVISPEEAQSEDQLQAIAKERASKRGMRYAGGIKPKGTMGQISQ